MTAEEARKLAPGIYRLTWSDDAESLAAVGLLWDGNRWFAYIGVAVEGEINVGRTDWANIARAELIITYDASDKEIYARILCAAGTASVAPSPPAPLTKREMFASATLNAIVIRNRGTGNDDELLESRARNAVKYADALIAELEKKK